MKLARLSFVGLRTAFLNGERRAVYGTLALTVANVLKIALQIAILPVMARLLGPSAYGLVALAVPLVLLANMISDAGLGNALVRTSNSSVELESTIFWLSFGFSFAMAGIVSLAAWPIAQLMSQPGLVPILIAFTVILPIGGSLSVANARISREGKFGLFAVSDVVATVASSLLGIFAAWRGAGPWSLVIQNISLWLIKGFWLLPVSGFRPRMIFRFSLVVPHLSFGLHSVGSNLADFANKNVPTLLIGSLIGITAAGHYSIAYQIVRLPELIISGPLYLSIFVAVAKWDQDGGQSLTVAAKGLRGVVTVLAPLFCGLALVANVAVNVFLGDAWSASGPILSLLAPAGFFLCVESFIGAVLMGLGKSPRQFHLLLLSGIFLATGVFGGAHYGAEGVAAGFSLGAGLMLPIYLVVFSRQLELPFSRLLHDFSAPLVAAAAMSIPVLVLARHLHAWPEVLQLAALILCGVVSFTVILAAISGRRVLEDIQWLLASNRAVPAEVR